MITTLKHAIFISVGATALTSCTTLNDVPDLVTGIEPVWVADGFESPESLIASADKTFFYVSNVNGDARDKDGNGYISKLLRNGSKVEGKWATGLDAPKGLALVGSKLYVTDIDRLVELDADTGDILNTYPAAEAKFLNDVAYVEDIGLLVSDSADQSIYHLQDGQMVKWLESEKLGGVNGLQGNGKSLLVSTMSAGELLSVDLTDKSISVVATNMKNADGIGMLGQNRYIVSSWPGQMHYVSQDGSSRILLDTTQDKINMNDLFFDGDLVYVPNWSPGTITAYKFN